MRLWNYIKSRMLEHPEQLICEGEASMTYEELCIYAEHRSQTLNSPCYAILCNSEMATAMALLSCIAAGRTAIPLPMRYGGEYCEKLHQSRSFDRICGSGYNTYPCKRAWISSNFYGRLVYYASHLMRKIRKYLKQQKTKIKEILYYENQ